MGEMLREKTYVPRQGVWEIAPACNMRCRHCGSHAGRPRDDADDGAPSNAYGFPDGKK
ncbi:MAG: hypothetical protein HY907_20105 [Deltaproteobacteria bacterium]|nr:hypothetical protein [Deltaproteobacteria bacterium]